MSPPTGRDGGRPTLAKRLEKFEVGRVYHEDSLGEGWWVVVEVEDFAREALGLIREAHIALLPQRLPTTPVECEHGYDVCPTCDAAALRTQEDTRTEEGK